MDTEYRKVRYVSTVTVRSTILLLLLLEIREIPKKMLLTLAF